jgi:hypothetical protein
MRSLERPFSWTTIIYLASTDAQDSPSEFLNTLRQLDEAAIKRDPLAQESQKALEIVDALREWRKGGKKPFDS